MEVEGTNPSVDLLAGVLKRALERNPGVQVFRVKIRAPVRFDYQNEEAHEFALNLNKKIPSEGSSAGGTLDSLPEFQALRAAGFDVDLRRSGLWHYQSGDVDHFYLVMTRPPP